MIQPQELRIGNLLYFKRFPNIPESFEVIKVNSISKNGFISFINDEGKEEFYYLDNFKKITITEEILLDFGFIQDLDLNPVNNGDIVYSKFVDGDYYYVSFGANPYFGIISGYADDDYQLKFIKYVHQLQNLYFALTGEELQFKST